MCPTNSEIPTPRPIPLSDCLAGCGNKAQPENGICKDCQKRKGTWPLSMGVALLVAVLGLVTGCVTPREVRRRESEAQWTGHLQGIDEARRIFKLAHDCGEDDGKLRWPEKSGMEILGDEAARETDAALAEREKQLRGTR